MSEMLRSVPGCATVLSMTMQTISSSSMCSPPGTQTTVMFLDMVVCGDAEMHGRELGNVNLYFERETAVHRARRVSDALIDYSLSMRECFRLVEC